MIVTVESMYQAICLCMCFMAILYRLDVTMPGYKVFLQDDGEIREGLTCCYCRLVLKDPVQTSESGLRFCKECYSKAPRLAINTSKDQQPKPETSKK